MSSKFSGTEGNRRVVELLRRQKIVQNSEMIARELAAVARILEFEDVREVEGFRFIKEGDNDCSIFFILAGEVSIERNGRIFATRKAGNTVGEMATIDTSARRSATAIANEKTVLAEVSEPDFSQVAKNYSDLWRFLAIDLAERLREWTNRVPTRNKRPKVFIGSSAEGLPVANAIEAGLDHVKADVIVWTEKGNFKGMSNPLDDLLKISSDYDFAIIVLTDDDTTINGRDNTSMKSPRDNCVFELGMFLGALGKKRTFLVRERGVTLKLPSDLSGVTPLEYAMSSDVPKVAKIGPVCTELRSVIDLEWVK
ncbi:MAG: hypothetical protein RLZZ505_30 [Verrucomicrobiota bacterium]|jgi:predicted nucleotide-binding protein